MPERTSGSTALIKSVEAQKGAVFIRDATVHPAHAAADQMGLKLGKAGDLVKTAEDFMEKCASKSSISGTPYEVRLAGGKSVPARTFLRPKLKEADRAPK